MLSYILCQWVYNFFTQCYKCSDLILMHAFTSFARVTTGNHVCPKSNNISTTYYIFYLWIFATNYKQKKF